MSKSVPILHSIMEELNSAKTIKERGKQKAAHKIYTELLANRHSSDLDVIIDDLLDLDKLIDDTDNIDWCRWLIAGGKTPSEFIQTGE
uniref:CSON008050 protein n=1 Tax=Culicoides sonorensis TaxID=179676 RepID=A0A336MVN7_CULSO